MRCPVKTSRFWWLVVRLDFAQRWLCLFLDVVPEVQGSTQEVAIAKCKSAAQQVRRMFRDPIIVRFIQSSSTILVQKIDLRRDVLFPLLPDGYSLVQLALRKTQRSVSKP